MRVSNADWQIGQDERCERALETERDSHCNARENPMLHLQAEDAPFAIPAVAQGLSSEESES